MMPAMMPASMMASHVVVRLHCGAAVCVLSSINNTAQADESERHDSYYFFQDTSPPDVNSKNAILLRLKQEQVNILFCKLGEKVSVSLRERRWGEQRGDLHPTPPTSRSREGATTRRIRELRESLYAGAAHT